MRRGIAAFAAAAALLVIATHVAAQDDSTDPSPHLSSPRAAAATSDDPAEKPAGEEHGAGAPAGPVPGVLFHRGQLNVKELLRAGGVIGYITIALSVAMAAMILEHLLSIRRGVIVPHGAATELRRLLAAGQIPQADALCRERPSFLTFLIAAGLQEADLGFAEVEKGMEDAAAEQAARLYRKVEYLAVIGAVAPMLGLMGTVWGMIQAFAEFAEKANPQPADFAPAISEALVTTLFGLVVAVPAVTAFAFFRNRVDELVAEAALTAGQVTAPLKRLLAGRRSASKTAGVPGSASAAGRPAPPHGPATAEAAEREPRR